MQYTGAGGVVWLMAAGVFCWEPDHTGQPNPKCQSSHTHTHTHTNGGPCYVWPDVRASVPVSGIRRKGNSGHAGVRSGVNSACVRSSGLFWWRCQRVRTVSPNGITVTPPYTTSQCCPGNASASHVVLGTV